MQSGVEFDNDSQARAIQREEKPLTGLSGWLVRKGMAKSGRQATYILLIILAVGIALIWAILGGSSSGTATGTYSPLEANQKALQDYKRLHPNGI